MSKKVARMTNTVEKNYDSVSSFSRMVKSHPRTRVTAPPWARLTLGAGGLGNTLSVGSSGTIGSVI